MHATAMLKGEHSTIKQMLNELEAISPRDGIARQALADRIAEALDVHTQLERELFYPALERVSGRVGTARVEHEEIERLLDDLAGRQPNNRRWARSFTALKQAVVKHVATEENVLFLDAERLGAEELERLGEAMRQRREVLIGSIVQRALRKLRALDRKTA